MHIVQEILDSFRAGTESVAEFWYRGCLEVSQDVTGIRALEGERRLLEWSRNTAS